MLRAPTIVVFALVTGCAADQPTDSSDSCALAAQHVADCTGESPDATELVKQCDADRAEQLLAMDCSSVAATGAAGKADGWWDSFMCGLGYVCHCSPEGAPFSQRTVDDSSANWDSGGPWYLTDSGGYDGGSYHHATSNHGASASWNPRLGERAKFSIKAFVPTGNGAGSASYAVYTCGGKHEITIDQSRSGWITLGQFDMSPGAYVALWGNGGETLADAMQFTKVQ